MAPRSASNPIGPPADARHEQFRALGIPAAVELGNMFQYYTESADTFTGARDLRLVRDLHPSRRTFRDWLSEHKAAIVNGTSNHCGHIQAMVGSRP